MNTLRIFFTRLPLRRLSAVSLVAALAGFGSGQLPAASIGFGNVIIYRVGDGSAALTTGSTPVFLDEYTVTGTLVQSLALPTSGGSAFTAVGNATTEGIISRSQDGSTFIFTGYRKAAGGTSPASDTYLVTSRVIGTLTPAGVIDTTTTLTSDGGLTSANTIRSATSVDGTSAFWTSTSSRIGYNSTPFAAGGTTQIDPRNSRQVNLSGNTLFAANGSTAVTGKVQHYGTLPTGATAPTPVVTLATSDAINGFALFDLSAGVPGDDTLYALSTVAGRLLKYTFDGSTWNANGFLSTTAINLTGAVDGGSVNLFLTTTSSLLMLHDGSGYGNNITGTLGILATAGANTAFRGVGVVPEPSTMGLALAGAACLLGFRRRR